MPTIGKTTILDPILWRLASKIQLATQLSTHKAFSATPMQVMNLLSNLLNVTFTLKSF